MDSKLKSVIETARRMLENDRDYSLAVYVLRDIKEVSGDQGLKDLAWALASSESNCTRVEAELFIGLIESKYANEVYKLTGTYRAKESIGSPEAFEHQIEAPSARLAMDQTRHLFYDVQGYDMILFKQVEHLVNNVWEVIPMMQALELE